jgi:hypothetical protein
MMNTPIELGASAAVDSDFSCPSQPRGGKVFKSTFCRWGDYAGASVDPNNGNVVWGSSQVNGPPGKEFEDEIEGKKFKEHGAQWATRTFALEANELAPTASFTSSPNPASTGSPVSFNGGASSDPDGTIAGYSWSFGDGSGGSGVAPSHIYATPGTYSISLTVTDNAGLTATTVQSLTVNVPAKPFVAPVPSSEFTTLSVKVNKKTGAITFTEQVASPGTFTWLLTFQNGPFGAFAAKTSCRAGLVKLAGKCRAARIVFAKGGRAYATSGVVSFTVVPTASAAKALKNALKRKRALPVSIVVTYHASPGGLPVSHSQLLNVRLKGKR